MGLGDEVTWAARHLGRDLQLTARITRFEPPHRFDDEMVRGPFRSMRHRHDFAETKGRCEMTDVFTYELPFGWLGALAARLLVDGYLRGFLRQRAAALKAMAEGQRRT